ncbi:MAG: SCO family protein [Proteobacteria bacterium]|nr:SCO family protein [Pseudomonadota bacterium]
MPIQKKTLVTTIGLIAVIALLAGFLLSSKLTSSQKNIAEQMSGTLLEKPRMVEEFQLTGIDSKPFNNESLKGQWTLVFFGFTHCATVCPMTMSKLNDMYLELEKAKINPLPQVVMISIDPKRDSLSRLNSFVQGFNPHFYGARGDNDAIVKMTKEMGIAFEVSLSKDKDPQNYDIQHSGALILFNPEGQLAAFFTSPFEPKDLAKDYQLVVS